MRRQTPEAGAAAFENLNAHESNRIILIHSHQNPTRGGRREEDRHDDDDDGDETGGGGTFDGGVATGDGERGTRSGD